MKLLQHRKDDKPGAELDEWEMARRVLKANVSWVGVGESQGRRRPKGGEALLPPHNLTGRTRQVGKHIVKCLEPFQKKDVKYGFISNKDDFKYLAKKVRCRGFVHAREAGRPFDPRRAVGVEA